MLTVQRRTVYHLTVTGAYSGTFVILTGRFEADQVTLFRFRNSTARGTLRGLTFDALLQFNQCQNCPGFSNPACTTERHKMKSETNFTTC